MAALIGAPAAGASANAGLLFAAVCLYLLGGALAITTPAGNVFTL